MCVEQCYVMKKQLNDLANDASNQSWKKGPGFDDYWEAFKGIALLGEVNTGGQDFFDQLSALASYVAEMLLKCHQIVSFLPISVNIRNCWPPKAELQWPVTCCTSYVVPWYKKKSDPVDNSQSAMGPINTKEDESEASSLLSLSLSIHTHLCHP